MKPPNIVLILADDMGYGDLSCMNPGSRIRTAAMDRVAAEGLAFTDAHAASSVCTPSRYSLLTGRYAWRGRLQRGVLGPLEAPLIEEGRPTLATVLRGRGYATACFGKWHLGMDWPFRSARQTAGLAWSGEEIRSAAGDVDFERSIGGGPMAHGFDSYFGVDVPNFPPYVFIDGERTVGIPSETKPEGMFGTPGPMLPGWDLEGILPAITERAVRFIEDQAGTGRPFFLYIPLTAPHTPIVPTAEFRGKSGAGVYGDWVLQVDSVVDRVAAALGRSGLADDTLLVVTSDNGSPGRNGHWEKPGTVVAEYGHNPSWILRGMKADAWDGGHRVPLLVRWPGRIAGGRRCDRLVCLMDLMATAASAAEATVPSGAAEDSLDLTPYLYGRATEGPVRRSIVHHGVNGLYGIREGRWKLIQGPGSGGFSPDPPITVYDPPGQLYDMQADISERTNLYFERPDLVCRLTDLLNRIRCGGADGDPGHPGLPASE